MRPEPLAVVVSRSLRLPGDLPLLQEPDRDVAIITESDAELPPTPARVTYLRGPLDEGLRRLRTEHGVRAIVCEGGPHLNRSLFPGGLADELFLSTSPLLAGGEPPLTILEAPPIDPPLRLQLVWLLESEQLPVRALPAGEQRGGRGATGPHGALHVAGDPLVGAAEPDRRRVRAVPRADRAGGRPAPRR